MTHAALEWTYQPWRETPGRAAAAFAFTVMAAVLLQLGGDSALLTALMTLAVAAQLASLLIPTRCRVDEDGVMARGAFGWERRAWSAVRRVRIGSTSLMVSPYTTRRWMDRFRTLLLPLPRERRSEVLAALRPILEARDLA